MNQLKNMTLVQWLGIIMVLNGVVIGSTTELTDLVGTGMAHHLVDIAAIGNSFVGGLITMFSGQSAVVQQLPNLPGVEKVVVNNQASPTLLQMAADPTVTKVESVGTAKGG